MGSTTVPFLSAFDGVLYRGIAVLPPYVSQKGNAPANDCGLACALMLARWNGKGNGTTDTVQWWSQALDPEDDGTAADQLGSMLKRLGLTPTRGNTAAYPYIELVRYAQLPQANKSDPNGTFTHWIVRLSDTQYHDPYHLGTRGANMTATKMQLDVAEVSVASRVGVAERPEDVTPPPPMTNTKWIAIPGGAPLRFTKSRENNDNRLNLKVPEGEVIEGVEDGEWVRVQWKAAQASIGLVALVQSAQTTLPVAYIHKNVVKPYTKPTPTPTPTPQPVTQQPASMLLGVNVLGNHQYAEQAYQLGCRFFLWMEGALGAHEFKTRHPDATVVYRKYIGTTKFENADKLIAACDGMGYPNLIYMGFNEADAWGQRGFEDWPMEARSRYWQHINQSGNYDKRASVDDLPRGIHYGDTDLVKRLGIDVDVARKLKQFNPTARYIAGTFSMGTPDFTDETVCQILRDKLAPHYNSGLLGVDMHLYSPTWPSRTMDHWFERRWEWFFTKCGFDPAVRNIYCTETGLDEGGVGGFPAHNTSDEEFGRWCDAWLQTSRLGINGKPSPVMGAALFQEGDTGRWGGYDIQRYIPQIQKRW